jgi:hypothetical protein
MFIRSLSDRIAFDADTGGAGGGTAGTAAAAPPPAFAESLPEDIRGEAVFKDIKDLGALAKGYVHAQRLIGADPSTVLRLPGADADQAAWDGVYAKLGRPEAADKYAFSDVKLPEGLAVDDGLKTGFQKVAHQAGLNMKQADALYQWWNAIQAERFTAAGAQTVQQQTAAIDGLRKEWGQAFDQNVALAQQAVAHYGGDKLRSELEGTGLGNNPELARIFAKLGRNLQEDGLIGKGGTGGGVNSPGEAQQQISALQQDQAFMKSYLSKHDPEHKVAVEKMETLYNQAYPQPPKT